MPCKVCFTNCYLSALATSPASILAGAGANETIKLNFVVVDIEQTSLIKPNMLKNVKNQDTF